MLYKLLGILVWNGAKILLRAKYGRTYLPAPVLAGAVVVPGSWSASCSPSATPTKRSPAFGASGPVPAASVWDHRGGDGIDPCLDPRRPHARGGRVAALGRRHRPRARARALVARRGAPAGLPVLCASVGGGVSRYESLPDAPSARAQRERLARAPTCVPGGDRARGRVAGVGERRALGAAGARGAGRARRAGVVEPEPAEAEPGGEVIDRAVLAERRARRAEAAEQAQARVASEALRALDALELRGTELEAARRGAGRPSATRWPRGRGRSSRRRRATSTSGRALADALAAAAAARRRARDVAAADARRRGRAHERRRAPARARGARGVGIRRCAPSGRRRRPSCAEAARARGGRWRPRPARAREQAVAAAADLDEPAATSPRRLGEHGAARRAQRSGRPRGRS